MVLAALPTQPLELSQGRLDPSKKPAGPRDCKMRGALLAVAERSACGSRAPLAVANVQGRLMVVGDTVEHKDAFVKAPFRGMMVIPLVYKTLVTSCIYSASGWIIA